MTTPNWQPVSGPPPRPASPDRGRGAVPATPAPLPLPLAPRGTPPPPGTAWPPPDGDPTVCLMREIKGRELITKCGRLIVLPKGDSMSKHATGWHTEVTCDRCRVRMGTNGAVWWNAFQAWVWYRDGYLLRNSNGRAQQFPTADAAEQAARAAIPV